MFKATFSVKGKLVLTGSFCTTWKDLLSHWAASVSHKALNTAEVEDMAKTSKDGKAALEDLKALRSQVHKHLEAFAAKAKAAKTGTKEKTEANKAVLGASLIENALRAEAHALKAGTCAIDWLASVEVGASTGGPPSCTSLPILQVGAGYSWGATHEKGSNVPMDKKEEVSKFAIFTPLSQLSMSLSITAPKTDPTHGDGELSMTLALDASPAPLGKVYDAVYALGDLADKDDELKGSNVQASADALGATMVGLLKGDVTTGKASKAIRIVFEAVKFVAKKWKGGKAEDPAPKKSNKEKLAALGDMIKEQLTAAYEDFKGTALDKAKDKLAATLGLTRSKSLVLTITLKKGDLSATLSAQDAAGKKGALSDALKTVGVSANVYAGAGVDLVHGGFFDKFWTSFQTELKK